MTTCPTRPRLPTDFPFTEMAAEPALPILTTARVENASSSLLALTKSFENACLPSAHAVIQLRSVAVITACDALGAATGDEVFGTTGAGAKAFATGSAIDAGATAGGAGVAAAGAVLFAATEVCNGARRANGPNDSAATATMVSAAATITAIQRERELALSTLTGGGMNISRVGSTGFGTGAGSG